MTFPKYIIEMLEKKRIALAEFHEQEENLDAFGYTFRLYLTNNHQSTVTLAKEAERLCAWARRQYAEARVVRSVLFTEKEHRKPFYKKDYILMIITDPVAGEIERDIKRRAEEMQPHLRAGRIT